MDNLFTSLERDALNRVAPLAVRMRPRTLDELVGQLEVIGEGTWLRNAIETDSLSSIILFGPAGTGKTTLARVIAGITRAHFTEVSAISGGVSDLRRVIDEAGKRLTLQNLRTILFVDEIHRFSRSQQDALLHAVEDRIVILIGATTENPFFEVNSALISRSRVIEFKTLTADDIASIVRRALAAEQGLGAACHLTEAALSAIVVMAGGDARMALTTLELAAEVARASDELTQDDQLELATDAGQPPVELAADVGQPPVGTAADAGQPPVGTAADAGQPPVGTAAEAVGLPAEPTVGSGDAASTTKLSSSDNSTEPHALQIYDKQQADGVRVITTAVVLEASPRRSLPYDKKGDSHYDVISAFIKSMRGSDADAAVYWLARMIEGGEDPKFIARRILIFASEDVGNADPQALLVGQAAFMAAQSIGYPECQLNLAQAAIYMALAPKSNSATTAIYAALGEVRKGPLRQVPNHLRDRHRPGSEDYAAYHYPHLDPSGWVKQQYLPDGLERGAFYTPSERGWEAYRSEAVRKDRDVPAAPADGAATAGGGDGLAAAGGGAADAVPGGMSGTEGADDTPGQSITCLPPPAS